MQPGCNHEPDQRMSHDAATGEVRLGDPVSPDRRKHDVDHRSGEATRNRLEPRQEVEVVIILDRGIAQRDERRVDNPVERLIERTEVHDDQQKRQQLRQLLDRSDGQ